ncbi:hypothetical protein FXO38_29446 [Capsicum annuum]|uniref:Uncharacterized protein n=1 Tax=Capsicum annuum TaxID=4072 RepID=A0A2G2YKX5_CAPAN|nr:hypothetical protein FXO38_29446 [Capsicum annuum]KAF3661573.1 hypothetical protein FXO37_12882 [Capsicum annuum]PHT70393.1 hypothetical protein T459_25497 [Capsicum annuum]
MFLSRNYINTNNEEPMCQSQYNSIPMRLEGGSASPLAVDVTIARIGFEATVVLDTAKSSSIQALQKVFPTDDGEGSVRRYGDNKINEFDIAKPFKDLREIREQNNFITIVKDLSRISLNYQE